MPVDDIRIWTGFLRSQKTKRLIRVFGDSGVVFILRLWLEAAEHRPKGVLTNWTAEDIADAADFDGDAEFFVGTLCDIGFLDENGDGVFELHNWRDRQPWVYFGPERTKHARVMAAARWGNKKKAKKKAKAKRTVNARSNAGSNAAGNASGNASRNPPSPNPTPKDLGDGNARANPNLDGDSRPRAFAKGRRVTGPEAIGDILKTNGIGEKKN